jgi:exodeoxyribonuclease-5
MNNQIIQTPLVRERYVPKVLRQSQPDTSTETLYAIGKPESKHVAGSTMWGMSRGPVNSELELLEECGETGDFILQFSNGDSLPLWKWADNAWNPVESDIDTYDVDPLSIQLVTDELASIKLTDDQKFAWAQIQLWIKSDDPYFILRGPAGTGKTHMLKMLMAHVKQQVYLSAPTNKATKVLSKTLKHPAKTTYSLFGLRMQQEEDSLVLTASQTPYFPYNSIVIMDEGGTANKALCNAVEQARVSMGLKILIVGDPYQLPPVGERTSPAWKVPTKFKARLKEVVRFDNQLLKLAIEIRKCISEKRYVSPLRSDHDAVKGIWKYKSQQTFQKVLLKRVVDDIELTKAVAWRNKTVEHYNKIIRLELGFLDTFNVKDLLMLAEPVHDDGTIIAHIDDEFWCQSVDDTEIILGDFANNVTIPVYKLNLLNEDQVISVNVPKSNVRLDDYLSKLARIAKASTGLGRKQRWDDFWRVKQQFTDVRYGYAITAHRAQGSTYTEMFVDQQDILSNPDKNTAFKCLNVACTRPTTRVNTF